MRKIYMQYLNVNEKLKLSESKKQLLYKSKILPILFPANKTLLSNNILFFFFFRWRKGASIVVRKGRSYFFTWT